ncbi:valine--tRNA ligase [Fusarium falciforme]|nr:valine--tRNA ligase [Fusarium falciforme]
MATNSGRGNPIGASEGLEDATNTPPAVPAEEKKSITESATPVHASGADAGAEGGAKVKTAKELEKERKKAEKQAKFEAKKAKAAASAPKPAKEKKPKEKKVEEEPLPEYVEDTPEGEKKRIRSFEDPPFQGIQPHRRRVGMVQLVGEGGLLQARVQA